ncbi:hypothetical protein FHS59_003455 [Algoriphagus iocasae]|uniref:SGNH/GDSL hydrolase family protein n=1 Tax=Algoriphagus iocasae TaxID=1836499 RepID=A0A841MHS1_9BACT|nr:hypothetical protein [Algoriphagus iocasae]MBB6327812.1 hypothetical protein [Algoriphagus iocasae]
MKRFFNKFIFLFFVVVLFYPMLIFISRVPFVDQFSINFNKLSIRKGGNTFLRFQDADTTQNIDLLILGSSMAYRGVDPRAFDSLGLAVFNLGTSGQTPMQTRFLIDKYLYKLNPKSVLWEISPFTFTQAGSESFLDLISVRKDYQEMAYMLPYFKDILPINAFLDRLLFNELESTDGEIMLDKEDVYIKGGFVETRRKAEKIPKLEEISLEMLDFQKEIFESVLDSLVKRNIKVYLFQSPVSEVYFSSIQNKETNYNYILEIANKYDVEFFDFNSIELCDCFYDEIHLTKDGVEDFNKELIRVFFKNNDM